MSKLVLIRHGQSQWNLEKKFTGWVDVDLAEVGILEAIKAGNLIKNKNISFDFYYSSLQLRANKTLEIIQEILNDKKEFIKTWQLNERHYGALTGLNKIETAKKIGGAKVHEFRRSWDIKPEPLDKKSPYHPLNIPAYKEVPIKFIPDTESLKDTFERVVSFFNEKIKDNLENKNILISAHGNSIRALCKHLFKLNNNQISELEIPTGNPLLIEINKDLIIDKCEYLDKSKAKSLVIF